MKKKMLYLILTSGLVFSLAACQKDTSDSTLPESEAQTQAEETIQTIEFETEASAQAEESSQAEEVETEASTPAEGVQNEFFSVVFDSLEEVDEFYDFTFIFTNVSDMAYYKGDELYQPGEFWEKRIRIKKEKLADYCKNTNYIHYKLYDLSVYDENTQQLFAGGASFKLNEELEVSDLEIFVDIPIEMN